MKIKRLNLDWWMEYSDHEDLIVSERCIEIKPIFGKNGYYYDRLEKREWFEVNGRAYANPRSNTMLLYELSLLNATEFTAQQVNEMVHLITTLPRSQTLLKVKLFYELQPYLRRKSTKDLTRIMKLINWSDEPIN